MGDVVDLSNLIENSMGDEEFVAEMILLFKEQGEKQLAMLEKLCIDGESHDWVEVSHSLKGTAAGVGAEHMRILCAQAQSLAVGSAGERTALYQQISSAFAACCEFLKQNNFLKGQ